MTVKDACLTRPGGGLRTASSCGAHRRRAIAHESRLPSRTATGPNPDQGTGDDEPAIDGSLADTSLCAPCIAMTCNIPFFRVERALERLKGSTRIRALSARCEGCWKITVVYARGLYR